MTNCNPLQDWARIVCKLGAAIKPESSPTVQARATGGHLVITNMLPFFLLMAAFVTASYFFCRKLSPYSSLIPELLNTKGYYLELESMRGLLALAVVVHHAVVYYFLLYYHHSEITGPNANFYSQLGTAPVTFFFFITGFLFWSKLIANPRQQPAKFVAARLRRLGPAYLGGAALAFTLVAAFSHFRLHDSPIEVGRDGIRMLLGQTPLLNGLSFAPWLWAVTWTLQFEFLFYLLVPFLGWFAETLPKSLLFIGICNLLYAGSLANHDNQWHLRGFYPLQTLLRFLSFTFCVGFLTAHLVRNERIRRLARSVWAAPVALALIGFTLYLLPPWYGPRESLCLAFPFVVIACGGSFWGVLRKPSLVFLGQISYSVYLIHCMLYAAILIPLFNVFGPAMRSPALYWTIVLFMGPIIVGMGTLWNHTFELPFLGRRRVVPRPVPIVGTTTLQSVPPA
jgi:peptidoglycan/LPS O-acetylase OafA/YrhL